MKILIAEDSDSIVVMYKNILNDVISENGYKKLKPVKIFTVDSYKSFKQQKLYEQKFDLAILDWVLVKSTAESILKKLDSKFKMVVTGYADDDNIRKSCIKYGITEDKIKDKFVVLKTLSNLFKEAINAI